MMKKPKRLRLNSLVLSKEGVPMCPRPPAEHDWVLGRAARCHLAHTTWPRVLVLTPHGLTKDGRLRLRDQNISRFLPKKNEVFCFMLRAAVERSARHWEDRGLTVTWYVDESVSILKGALTVFILFFFVLFKWNVSILRRLICSPLTRKP